MSSKPFDEYATPSGRADRGALERQNQHMLNILRRLEEKARPQKEEAPVTSLEGVANPHR